MATNCRSAFYVTLCAAVLAVCGAVNAQVFAPRGGTAQNNNAAKVTRPVTNSAGSQNINVQSDSSAVDAAPVVKKNFSGEEKKVEYNNSSPKIISFKVVNGEVVLDEDKERSILVYYDNYQVHRGLDDYVRCSLRIYVLNDLKEKITSLGFKLYWPQISTAVQMNQLNPGVNTYKDIMLMGDGCFALDETPTIEVNRCRVKNMSQDKCADAVRWYKKS